MYVIVRRDLVSPEQIVVQSCHAALEAGRCFAPPDLEHPSVVLCGIRNEPRLLKAYQKIQALGIPVKAFHEPDVGNEMTAIATGIVYDDQRKHFDCFNLLDLSICVGGATCTL